MRFKVVMTVTIWVTVSSNMIHVVWWRVTNMVTELLPPASGYESGMEAVGFSERLAVISQTLWCHIPRR